jgi:hypothetical protein
MVTNDRISGLGEEVGAMHDALPIKVATGFPLGTAIRRLQVQVWHTADQTKAAKLAGHTEWSLRIESWDDTGKAYTANVGLFPQKRLLAQIQKVPSGLRSLGSGVNRMTQAMLGGMPRASKGQGRGRGYCSDQIAFLINHAEGLNTAYVFLSINDIPFRIDHLRMAGGNGANSALWFGSWTRQQVR